MPAQVLLVDDSQTMREIFKVYLMGGKYVFTEAATAARALQLLRLVKTDIVVADVNMPGMDGLEFVKQVRANERPEVRTVPVVLISGDKSQELGARAVAAGANAFLRKPVDAQQMVTLIEQLIAKRGA
jgi:two-component system chemotaxis response regulator CheY